LVDKNVLPGDFLSTEEEFEPGSNTFAENGSIFSNSVGKAVKDSKQKTILVKKPKDISVADVGDIVYGEVMLVKDNSVQLSIFTEPSEGNRKVLSRTIASLPIRLVSKDYVKNMRDMFKIGDLVKAKIVSVKPYGIDVRTNEMELGVIRAFCSCCRQPLHLFGRQLKCLRCGKGEQRKVSQDYALK